MLIGSLLAGVAIALGAVPQLAAQRTGAGETTDHVRFSVREFGATGDGATLDTRAIEEAIVAAHKAGGGTVVFPPGVYVAGTFELLSNVTLEVGAGAVLQASRNLSDYKNITDFGFGRTYGVDYTGEGTHVGLIVAQNADNVAIVGKGAIDGAGDAFFDFTKPHYSLDFDSLATRQGQAFLDTVLETGDGPAAVKPEGRAGTMIIVSNSSNVLMRDITLRNAPNWTVHLANVHGGVFQGVHILNDLRIPNNDGVDCIGCRDVHFTSSDIRAGDDDFAIVGSEDVTVTNCSMVSNSSAIRVEDTRSSVFSNLIIHANRGIGLYERGKGTTASVLFSGIVIETHLLTGHWWGKGEPIYIAAGKANGVGGVIRNVRFSNITAEAESGIVLYGAPGAWLSDITFDQVSLELRVTRKAVNAAVGGNFDLRWTTESRANGIFQHDIPGLYARYVSGLNIHGMTVRWADTMPDYYSSALQFEDVDELSVDEFNGRQAPTISSSSPVIAAARVNNISICNSRAAKGSSTFLSLADVAGERLFVGNDLSDASRAFSGQTSFSQLGNRFPAGPH